MLDYLIRKRRQILLTAVLFAVAAALYVLIADPAYESRAILMPPMEKGGDELLTAWMASMNLPSMISPMSAGSTSAQVMIDILGSRALAEKVVRDLDLIEWYRADNMDDAVRRLRGTVSASSSPAGVIRLRARDRDPVMAKRIVSRHIAALDSINRSLTAQRAEGTLEFTRKQIESYRRRLERLRTRIADFQESNGIINIDEQIRGAMDVATALKIRAALTAVRIDILREYSLDDAFELNRKKLELENINRQLGNIIRGDSSVSVFPPLESLPALMQEYSALQRDLEVNERVYSFLLQKHEESGIDMARTTASVQVVDPPVMPENRAGLPRWAFILVAFAAGGAWMSLVLAWWAWTSMKERSGEEDEAFRSIVDRVMEDVSRIRGRFGI